MIRGNKLYGEILVGSVLRKKLRIFMRIIVYILSLIASSGFTHSKEIKILMLESSRYLDDGAGDKLLRSACLKWQLSTDDINKIFNISENVLSEIFIGCLVRLVGNLLLMVLSGPLLSILLPRQFGKMIMM